MSAFNHVKFYTKKSRMMTDWRKNLYHSYKFTPKNWKLTIHKSILKCDLSKVVHTSRCPYPESSTVCGDTNTLKLGLSRVVHSLAQFMTTHRDLSRVVHSVWSLHYISRYYPYFYGFKEKTPLWYDMAYKNLYISTRNMQISQ